jgi:cAMP phosphodiesterase
MAAVDAGTLLASICRTLERHEPVFDHDKYTYTVREGPFVGLELPSKSPRVNAAHVFREMLGIILVTHPHLDHLSGLAINTPMLQGGNGPKPIAALPSVHGALRNHLFNDIIWPNMSDEDGGAGLLTYQRLIEGGNQRFGRGETLGYVQACHGLLTKCLGASHGHYNPHYHKEGPPDLSAPSPRDAAANPGSHGHAVIESSAFFIRDQYTGREVIVFGDIEPDSISDHPRNKHIWEAAAPHIAQGALRAIFIECSYDDSVDDTFLYGHLCPRHLISELSVLAAKVEQSRQTGRGGFGVSDELAETDMNDPRVAVRENEKTPEFLPLAGLSVYVIHVKDCFLDGPARGDRILQELRTQGKEAGLGCEFHVPSAGEGIWI